MRITKYYTVRDVAEFFERTQAWVYWCLANDRFVYENGDAIKPAKLSKGGGKKYYDLDGLQEIALALYRFGQIKEDDLRRFLAKILVERDKELEDS